MNENILLPITIDMVLDPAEVLGALITCASGLPDLVLADDAGTARVDAGRWTGDGRLALGYVRLVTRMGGHDMPPLWEFQLRATKSKLHLDRWVARLLLARLRLQPSGGFLGGPQLAVFRHLFRSTVMMRDPTARIESVTSGAIPQTESEPS